MYSIKGNWYRNEGFDNVLMPLVFQSVLSKYNKSCVCVALATLREHLNPDLHTPSPSALGSQTETVTLYQTVWKFVIYTRTLVLPEQYFFFFFYTLILYGICIALQQVNLFNALALCFVTRQFISCITHLYVCHGKQFV